MARWSNHTSADLSKELNQILNTYATEVREDVDLCCKDAAVKTVEKIKEYGSDIGGEGKYMKSWAIKEVAPKHGVGTSTWVIHNKKHYRLTHLLEKGHVKRGGNGRVKAFPHIKPAELWVINELPKELKNKLGG